MPRRGGSGRAEEASGSGRRKRGRMETAATGAVTSTSAMDASYTEMFGMCSNAAAAVNAAAAAAASENVANAYGAMSQTPMGLEVPMARMATYGYAPAGASVDRSGTGDGGVVFAPSPPPPVSTMNATATGQQQLNAMQAYANAYIIAQQWNSYFQQQAARNQAVADARMPTHVSNAGSMTFSPEVASEELRKRSRLVWTPALHARFVDAVQKLGEKTAVPKAIMKLMNVEGLTRENIASHLQKYRQHQKRLHDSSESTMAGMETTSLKGGKTRRKRKKDHQSHSGSGGEQGSGQGSRPSNEGQDSGSGARDENTRNVKVSSSEEEPVDPGTRRLPVAS